MRSGKPLVQAAWVEELYRNYDVSRLPKTLEIFQLTCLHVRHRLEGIERSVTDTTE
jgi:hypothetical protein